MNNQSENKLVIASEPDYGKEFYLLPGRTTIGSAPGNDLQIGGRDISGFHAEFNIENNKYYISDFSSEKGTFVNNEKIAKEKQVEAGDIIKIGSTRTVFIPRNAIFVKEKSRRINYLDAIKIGASTYKKWVIAACVFLVLISAIKMITGKSSNDKELQKNHISKKSKIIGTTHSDKDIDGAENGQKDTKAKAVFANNVDSTIDTPNDASSVMASDKKNEAKLNQEDNLANIYFKIANKFSEYQLWHDALEHYNKILEKNYVFPGVSAKIDKMHFEINNQKEYQHGQRLITNGSYNEGIAKLKKISPKSFYYNKAVQAISDAKESWTQSSKN